MPDTTCHMSISLDGFVAGPHQSREHPIGQRGLELHGWHIGDQRANEADEIATGWLMRPRGAYVMGRNMFGPIRGEWEGDWRGWWGAEPPYHAPVFVLTHHAHEPIEMDGGTTFYFVTDGFDAAYAQARATAGEEDVDIAGVPRPFDKRSPPGSLMSSRSTSPQYCSGLANGSLTAVHHSGSNPSRCCIRRWPRTSATAGPANSPRRAHRSDVRDRARRPRAHGAAGGTFSARLRHTSPDSSPPCWTECVRRAHPERSVRS
ncbi:dihydrofolate reductase [Leifsonia psychrotolerans]|uniref:Dihydrofolate reductase n=1 Tax=Glaciibacter psychrotolerans TaxID=670054 RepID=A0A7Z0EED4_9MICO|nr:dihydrofolate reductase [Leifsonia psychrotolerans]